MRVLLTVVFALFLSTPTSAAQDQDATSPVDDCAERQLRLVLDIHAAAHTAGGKLPARIEDAFKEPRSPEWKREHARYVYLGIGGINVSDLPDWGSLALTHLDFDAAHVVPSTPENPDGRLITVGFLKGYAQRLPPAEAARIIARSKAIFAAVRDGAPFPDREQVLGDLDAIAYGVHQYTRANHGLLPLDQGEIYPRMPSEGRYAKAADRARAFLIPRSRANTFVPENPTPEWIMEKTSYIYLAGAGLLRDEIPDSQRMILMHGPLDADIEDGSPGGPVERCVPVLTVHGWAHLMPRKRAEMLIEETKLVFDAMDRGTPLPPYQHALRDLRLIAMAIQAYTRANDGRMPPDLGATLPYLPPLPKGMTKAQVFLSPRAESSRRNPPDDPSPEWINRHGNYVYLGGHAGSGFKSLARRSISVLVHGPLDEPHQVTSEWCTTNIVVPHAEIRGYVLANRRETLEQLIPQSLELLRAAESPEPR